MQLIAKAERVIPWLKEFLRSNRVWRYCQHLRYGNTVDPANNKKYLTNWKKAIKSSGFSSSELHKNFIKQGYVSLGPIFSPELIKKLQMEFQQALQGDTYAYDAFTDPTIFNAYNHGGYTGDVSSFRRDIKDCSGALTSLPKIWQDNRFRECLKEILRADFQEDGIEAWRNYHVPKEIYEKFEVTTNRFHFDHQYVDRVKIFIYLSDVDLEDGPFQHFSRPYSRFLLLNGFSDAKRKLSITSGLPENIVNSSRLIKHTGKVGHVVVCATSFCIHRAGEVAPGRYRDLLQLAVRPKV